MVRARDLLANSKIFLQEKNSGGHQKQWDLLARADSYGMAGIKQLYISSQRYTTVGGGYWEQSLVNGRKQFIAECTSIQSEHIYM
jgi:hypothetical protein